MKENRLKKLLRIRKLSELPIFGRVLVVLFSLFFGIFVKAVVLIRKKGEREVGDKTPGATLGKSTAHNIPHELPLPHHHIFLALLESSKSTNGGEKL